MYQTLYRKYRPRTFSDVCGQERITTVLSRQVEEGTLTHAYLFCGTRGTGKTTCAKILAKVANCLHPQNGEPCNECENCLAADRGELLDILEVDAASHTGVENIRKLCEELNFMPAQGKKRVYIIDEVHMLSIGAFNALLKTLEEPPSHALFILATTELHKVPATVRSRCQCFTFHRISLKDIASRVLYVSEKEQIPLEEDGARLIARLSDGAMRDALSLLELCVGQKAPLNEELLDHLFGLGDAEAIKDLALSLLHRDSATALGILDDLYRSMGDLKEILSQTLGAFRDMLMYRVGCSFETTSNRTGAQQEQLRTAAMNSADGVLLYAVGVLEEALVRFERLTVNKKTICEMAFLRICMPATAADQESVLARIAALEEALQNGVSVAPAVSAKPEKPQTSKVDQASRDDVPWAEEAVPSSNPAPKKPTKQIKTASDPVAPSREKALGCAYGDALLSALGASDPLFASFCTNLVLQEEGNVLHIYGESFTVMMLQGRKQEIFELAKKHSPNLTAVEFSEGKPKTIEKPADLGEF